MTETEKLEIKLGISGTYWNKCPDFSISINGQELKSGTITAPSDTVEYHSFVCELEEQEHVLGVRLLNKEMSDTVQNEDKSAILNDLLLNIVSIEIDEVELGPCKWKNSVFVIDQPVEYQGQHVTELKNCVNLGFNGEYQFKFSTPYYVWLLENM
jgi:hypothetical protein